jgi:hypothetical protein
MSAFGNAFHSNAGIAVSGTTTSWKCPVLPSIKYQSPFQERANIRQPTESAAREAKTFSGASPSGLFQPHQTVRMGPTI